MAVTGESDFCHASTRISGGWDTEGMPDEAGGTTASGNAKFEATEDSRHRAAYLLGLGHREIEQAVVHPFTGAVVLGGEGAD